MIDEDGIAGQTWYWLSYTVIAFKNVFNCTSFCKFNFIQVDGRAERECASERWNLESERLMSRILPHFTHRPLSESSSIFVVVHWDW